MRSKMDCIMIVDDSMSDNFLTERMIQRMGVAKHVAVMRTGHGAIDHLTSADKNLCLPPQLILLDVEMPGMNGWQFLEAFENLHELDRSGEIIMMLTEADETVEEVSKKPIIKDYMIKPLTEESLRGMLDLHFPG